MTVSELILEGQTFRISRKSLLNKCEQFIEDSSLFMRPYEVQSSVSRDNFQVFIDAINGGNIAVTDKNVSDLDLLCKEFKFTDLSQQVEEWCSVNSSIDWKARRELINQKGRIDDLEQKLTQQGKEVFEQLKSHEQSILTVERDTKEQHELFEDNEGRATAQKKENEAFREGLASLKGLIERQERAIAELQKDDQNQRQEIANIKQAQLRQEGEIMNLKNESIRQQGDIKGMKTEGDKQKQTEQQEHKLLDGKIAKHEKEINQMRDEVNHLPGKVQKNLSHLQKELAKLKDQMEKWEQTQQFNPNKQPSLPLAVMIPTVSAASAPTSPAPLTPTKRDAFDSTKPKDSTGKQPQTPPKPIRITPLSQGKRFAPSDVLFTANKWKPKKENDEAAIVPLNGIIAHLTRECGGNVHDRNAVAVTSGSFERETQSTDSPVNHPAKNVADLENEYSYFCSAYRKEEQDIPHVRNNWICYDFGKRRIVPTHYAVRSNWSGVAMKHLKNWVVETSRDGKQWTEVDRKEDNGEMRARGVTRTFAVSGDRDCRFIRLVNVGRNWAGDDRLEVSAWEIFGMLIED